MKEILRELLSSKKFIAALVSAIIAIAGKYGFQIDEATLYLIIGPFITYIIGQGIADHGKNTPELERQREIISLLENKLAVKQVNAVEVVENPEPKYGVPVKAQPSLVIQSLDIK